MRHSHTDGCYLHFILETEYAFGICPCPKQGSYHHSKISGAALGASAPKSLECPVQTFELVQFVTTGVQF